MGENGCFVRPASIPKRVWGRHKSFRIEDVPDDKMEDVIKHMMEDYFQGEPTTMALRKITPYSDEDKRKFVTNALKHNMSLVAVDENNGEIAGVTLVRVASRADPHRHIPDDTGLTTMKNLFDFLTYCLRGVDSFAYGSGSSKVVVDHVLEPQGLSVSTGYRGKGVGRALVRARHKMALEFGIRATRGFYTSIYSQAILLGEKGMVTLSDVPYSDYLLDGVAVFAELNPPHPSAKIIGGLLSEESS